MPHVQPPAPAADQPAAAPAQLAFGVGRVLVAVASRAPVLNELCASVPTGNVSAAISSISWPKYTSSLWFPKAATCPQAIVLTTGLELQAMTYLVSNLLLLFLLIRLIVAGQAGQVCACGLFEGLEAN